MPTLDDLKAQHPEWCFNCGHDLCTLLGPVMTLLGPVMVMVDGKPAVCHHSHLIAALIAKAREDEARIAGMLDGAAEVEAYMRDNAKEKAKRPEAWAWGITEIALYAAQLRSELANEREAHEVTRKALEEADRALLFWRGYPEYVFSSDMEDGEPKQAVSAALAREEARKKEVKG